MQSLMTEAVASEEFQPVRRILLFPKVRKWLFCKRPEEGFVVEGFRSKCFSLEMQPPPLEGLTVSSEEQGVSWRLFSSSGGANCLKLLVPSHIEDGFLFSYVFGELYLVSPSNYLNRDFEPFCKRSVYDMESGEVLESIWYRNGILVLNYARFMSLCQAFYHAFIFTANSEERSPGRFLESTKIILKRSFCSFCGQSSDSCRCQKHFSDIITKHSFSIAPQKDGYTLEIPFELLKAVHFGNFNCTLRHYGAKIVGLQSVIEKDERYSCPKLELAISGEMTVKEMPRSTFVWLSHRMIQLLLTSLGLSRLLSGKSSELEYLRESRGEQSRETGSSLSPEQAARNRRYRRKLLVNKRHYKYLRRETAYTNHHNNNEKDWTMNNDYEQQKELDEESKDNLMMMEGVNHHERWTDGVNEKKMRKMIRNREYARESYNRRKARLESLEAENQFLKEENESLRQALQSLRVETDQLRQMLMQENSLYSTQYPFSFDLNEMYSNM
eukprot:jgi/Galph1/2598/GphlegSOOS_G1245.1